MASRAPAPVAGSGRIGHTRRWQVLAGQLVVLLLVGLIWEWLANSRLIPPAFIGRPSVFVPFLLQQISEGSFIGATIDTISVTLAAFAIGGVAALGVALVLIAVPVLRELLDPYLTALNSLPRVALIPLFIIWFGLGPTSKIASGVSLMFFVLLSSTLAGAQSVDPDHIRLARSLGLRGGQVFLQIVVPTALPSIFAGLRLGLIYTLLGVVTAELVAGGRGLGSQVSYFSNTFDANGVFATLLVLVVLSGVLSAAMTALEQRLARWQA